MTEAAGKKLAVRAEKILNDWEETKIELDETRKEKYLFIMSTGSLGYYGLEDFVRRLFTDIPNSTFSTNVGPNVNEIIDLLENNSADIGLYCHGRYSKKLTVIPAAVEKLCFVCRADSDYPDELSVKDLDPDEELYFIWNQQSLSWHNNWFGNKGHYETIHGSLLYLKYMFQSRNNWALLPMSIYHKLGPGFKTCRLAEAIPDRYLYFTVNSNVGITETHEKVLELLKETISDDFVWLDSDTRVNTEI